MTRWGVCLFACLLVSLAQAASWPEFDRPDYVETDWVANDLVYNGNHMYIENIQCDCKVERILTFYRKHWAELDERGFVENNLGELQQISRGDEEYFFSVQVKQDPADPARTVGRLVITKLPGQNAKPVVLGEGVPMPAESEVVNDIYDAMPGKRSRTVLLLNEKSIVDVMDFYRNHYESRGWNAFLVPVNPAVGSQALSYRKDQVDVNVAIHDQDGVSVILFNEVKTVF